jgi:hypothetical protein
MQATELSMIEEVLRSQLGKSARWHVYDREIDSPMSFVLARAEQHLRSKFCVYWVDDAPAEVFCLGGFSEPVAVFSTRYIELWADVRAVMANDTVGADLIPRMAERLFLRLHAELSLSKNDPEFAACAILKSVMAGQGLIQVPTRS